MSNQGIGIMDLVNLSGIDQRVVEAIVAGRYKTSPVQRQRLADVIGVLSDNIGWGQAVEVDQLVRAWSAVWQKPVREQSVRTVE